MTRVLIVDDDHSQAAEFAGLLRDAQCEVTLAGNGRQAIAAIRRELPDVVLTDLDMPEMDGLELVRTIRREFPALPVILMTAMGSESTASRALQEGAASYVRKQHLGREVVRTLASVLSVARALPQEGRLLDCLHGEQLTFVLDNDPALVPPLIGYLEHVAATLHPGDRTERMRVGIALGEALLNAIHHGNLELSSDLRQGDERVYHDLGEQRRLLLPYKERRVRVHASLTRSEAVYTIDDEGPGFDARSVPDPRDPANIERVGGRGLMMIRLFMDSVEHNERGNRIVLRKTYGATASPSTSG